ncbi:MAG: permease, partial [Acidobacteriaceae bacterium]|nr:permease [Acidobacteriaceae bacterium]
EFAFAFLHLIPQHRNAQIMEETIRWNYTSILNILFLALAVLLFVRFLRTGGPEMLRMMNHPAGEAHEHAHTHKHHGHHHQM